MLALAGNAWAFWGAPKNDTNEQLRRLFGKNTAFTATADVPIKEAKTERADLGKEAIDGHPCVKQKVVITDEVGKQFEIIAWAATDLNEFPIRSEMQSDGDMVVTTFRAIKLTKPVVALFDLPADFHRYDNVQELMMDSVQRMMGGQ